MEREYNNTFQEKVVALGTKILPREENAKQNKLRLANFPYKKYIEDLDMDALPEDGRKKLKNFLTLEFIKTRTKYNFSWKSWDW